MFARTIPSVDTSSSTSRWTFARAISSVEIMKLKLVQSLTQAVDGCHQWKVTRMDSKSSSSTSTIIEYFGMSYMNLDKSWLVNYGSSLSEKEENFNNLCCESSKPTVEYHEKGSQDSNNVETKMNLQACIGNRCLHDADKPGPPRKAAAAVAAAAILCQCIWGQSPSIKKGKNPSRGQNLEYNSWMIDVEKTLFETHLKVCLLRHHDRRHSEEARATYWMLYFQY